MKYKSTDNHLSQKQLESLFYEYKNQIYGFALKNLKSETLANDVVQEVFLTLCKKNISEIRNIRSFIFQVTRNKVVDLIREHAKDQSLREKMWKKISQEQTTADQPIIEIEYFEQLHKAKTLLTPRQLLIFELSREEGLTQKEIAKKLNLSINTVKNHMVSGMKTLKKYLQLNSDIVLIILLFLQLT